MRNHIIYIILTVSCLAACNSKGNAGRQTSTNVKRFGSVTGIRQDKIPYYRQLHANAWPGVLKKIGECNIRNYSIYLQKIDTGYYLFSYFEYTGSDFEQDMKKMATDTTTQRWWKETDPVQLPLSEAKAKSQVWTEMEEVFHSN